MEMNELDGQLALTYLVVDPVWPNPYSLATRDWWQAYFSAKDPMSIIARKTIIVL